MYGRSKRCLYAALLWVLMLLTSACSETVEQQVAKALQDALEDLYAEKPDVDAYMQRLDFGQSLDSIHYTLFADAIRQQLQFEGHASRVRAWSKPKVKMQNDSVATVFYTLYLADGDSLCKGQKMVCDGGVWKLRMKD